MSTSKVDMTGAHRQEGFFVVGIGASAGGVHVLQDFFNQVPIDSGMAYIVILHLSPEYESELAGLLQPAAPIPIVEVTEKVSIQPDHIYIVRPSQHLLIQEESICPSDNLNMDERRAPVDILFRTLADNYGSRAVCVVLSGTGANGSMGLKRIKEMGGAVYVQSPREAEFNEMPRNSIATDMVDEVLPVAEIPARIIHYRDNQGSIQIVVNSEHRPDDQQQALREIFTQIRLRTGHDFSNYKRPTLLRRIERRINIRNLTTLPAYADYIQQNPEETIALLKDLLISVTNFFRDKKAFQVIEQEVLSSIIQAKSNGDQVRIWVAGCATGEEAYSLAMLCAERTLDVIDGPKVQIFATDIDEAAIAAAREGLYTINDAADVSPERLRRFFNKEVDGFRVRREIREMILFANHNFIKDPAFSRLDLISCRNVLIYLNHTAQERVMETFHFALNHGGFLFLGNSESVYGASDLYSPFNRENHIFRSRQVPVKSYPIPESVPSFLYTQPGSQQNNGEKETRSHRFSFGELHQRLLEEYGPPSVVVNEEYEIVHMTEKVGKYLQFAGGEPTQNLLKLVAPELRVDMRSALYQAVTRQTPVETRDLRLMVDGQPTTINIHIRPVLNSRDTSKGFILIVFEPADENNQQTPVMVASEEPLARQLEEELLRVKGQLRTAVEQHEFQAEELKASNEELQAMNEELRSAAEELETSKEELQSINEELRTVNQELKIKIEEIVLTSNNLQNLINSANIGTIFLDRSFRVALFTPPVREVFNLIDSDYGRPITDITSRLHYDQILQDAERVLDNLLIIEREVTTTTGKTLLMRVLPYRTTDDRINGVVITFFDITNRKKAEESFRKSEDRFRAFVTASSDAIYRTNADWTELVNLKGLDFISDSGEPGSWLERYIPAGEQLRVRAEIHKSIQTKTIFELEHQVFNAGGNINWAISRAIPLLNAQGDISEWFGTATDITERRQAEEALRESEQRFRTLTQTVPALIWFNDGEGYNRYANQRFLDFTGNAPAEITGKPWQLHIHEDDASAHREDYLAAMRERRMFHKTFRARRSDGEWRWLESFAQPLFDATGIYLGHVGVTPDVTESRQQEEAVRDSEARFRTLTNAIPQVIWANDENGKANYFNRRWFDYSGLAYEESVGKGWEAIVHPDDAPASVSEWRKVLANGEVFDTEYRLRNADGVYRWFIGRNVPLKDASGKVLGWFGSATDIEDLKQTEELVRSTGERLQLALDAGKLGSYEYDFHTGLVSCTAQHYANYGLNPNDP